MLKFMQAKSRAIRTSKAYGLERQQLCGRVGKEVFSCATSVSSPSKRKCAPLLACLERACVGELMCDLPQGRLWQAQRTHKGQKKRQVCREAGSQARVLAVCPLMNDVLTTRERHRAKSINACPNTTALPLSPDKMLQKNEKRNSRTYAGEILIEHSRTLECALLSEKSYVGS